MGALVFLLAALCHSGGWTSANSVSDLSSFDDSLSHKIRFKREPQLSGNSILTVEWEGIHSGVPDDKAIGGFIVEYRPETATTFIQHDGLIRYQGPNVKYRVKIKDLPSGMIYYVRIKVIGRNGDVLVQTPEIKAQSETVQIVCDGRITQPRNIRIVSTSRHSVTYAWEAPECGNIQRYNYRVEGYSDWARFDVHTGTVTDAQTTISNLLPGTTYNFRISAIDPNNRDGPWTDYMVRTTTEGSAPRTSDAIRVLYKTDTQIRVEWEPVTDANVQHYEVIILEQAREDEAVQVFRTQVPPTEHSFVFTNLKPSTNYLVGVIAFADFEPKQLYRLRAATSARGALPWSERPTVSGGRGIGKFVVQWETPGQEFAGQDLKGFIIEYRLPNETTWRRYGGIIEYRPGQREYTTDLVGFSDRVVYVIRVFVVNTAGEVVAVTDEFNVGTPTAGSCTGPQGAPQNAEAYYVGQTTITYSWQRPQCDESYGPVEGYEYSFWNLDRGTEPDRPTFISTNRVTLDNLTPSHRYAFKVRSRSRAGYSPWSGMLTSSTKPGAADGNIYKLRIVLAVSKSYLVWTPTPQDRSRIDRFRVSYKISTTDHWQRIEDLPNRFQCPSGVGEPGDFCYDLSDLKFGIQYTADVVYRLNSGEWSKQGNPLFFILVEAVIPIFPTPEPPRIPESPAQLTVTWQTETSALATWLPPLSADVRIDEYKITVRVLTSSNPHVVPGHVRVFTTPGNVFRYSIENLFPDTVYNVSVVAGSRGYYGPPLFEIVGQVQVNPEIRQLRVEEKGDVVTLKWDVAGPLRRLCCYQIDIRSDRDPQWRPYGPRIPQEGDRRYYTTDLRGLEGNTHYFVQVRGLAPGDETLCTSDSVRFRTHCKPPSAPPDNIDIRAADSRTVVVSFTHPDRSTWGCEDISYVIEGTINGRPQRIPLTADTRGFRVEHRLPSDPGADWRIRVQTVNSAGASPWSREYTLSTPSEAYVSPPRLTPHGNQLRVDWQSQGRGTGVVYGYLIEYRTSQDPRWQRSESTVPYTGDNVPYSGSIHGLPRTGTTFVRILVLDRNQQVIYTSPEASAESRCNAPSQPPVNVQIEAPDARHVRVTWLPPPPDSWGCDDIFYELEVIEPRGTAPARLNRGETVHVFDARPNERWAVQIRAVNSAGASQWARTTGTRTPPPGELITGLFVSYPGGVPTLQWMSIDGVGDLVSGYRLEVMSENDRNWRSHSSGFIRYVGSQRPYVVTLDDLPEGQRVFVRVQVIDQNNGVHYTSPQVPVQTPSRCRPPSNFPSDITVVPGGSNRIRVNWRPLTRPEWNCDSGWYIVRYTSPSASGVRNFTSGESVAVFESQPATSWQFQIQAENPSGASSWSPLISGSTDTGAPGAPEDLRVTPAGPGSVRVTWRPPANAHGQVQAYDVTYQLLSRGLCAESPEPEVTVTTRDPFYVLQTLHPHSRYRITVVARTNVPGVPVSQEITTEPAAPTGPPRSLQASDTSSRRVTLTWQAPPCLQTNGEVREYEYELQGVDPWATREIHKSRTVDTRAVVDALTPYTKYRAKVRAYTSHGPGPWSSDIIVTTEPSDDPTAPPLLRVLNSRSDAIELYWQGAYPPHGDIDRYKVQFAIGGTGRWSEREFRLDQLYCAPDAQRRLREQAPPGANVYCVTIVGLEPEQSYDFQVAAHVIGRRWGPWSNVETGRTGGGPVRVLTVESVAAGADNLEVRWTVRPSDQGRVRGFRVIAHPLTDPLRVQQFIVDGPIFQHRIDGLQPNTAYNVTVQARTETSSYYDGASATLRTVDVVLPTPQTPPRITAKTADSVAVEWTTPYFSGQTSPITGYIVEYRTPARTDYTRHNSIVPHISSAPTHSAVVTGLPPNTEVSVRYRNVGRNNQIGNPSPDASARTDCMEPSLPPQGIRLDTRSEPLQVIVSWQRPSESSWRCDQVSYEISYRTGDQAAEQVVRAGAQLSEYSLPSPPYTRWTLRMRTVNRVGASPWSDWTSITTPEIAPGRVRNLRLTPLSPNEVLVNWDPPAEKPGVIVGYDVSYRLKHRLACPEEEPKDVSRSWITVYNVKGSEYTLTGLLPYSEYEVKLQARTTELGPELTKTVQTLQQGPSAPPLDLKSTFVLERGLGFSWQPIECSQRHGPINVYEYELLGQDDWAKLEVRIANTSQLKLDIDGLTPFTKYVMRVKGYNNAGGGPSSADLEIMTSKADAPLPPQDLTVLSEGHDFISVSWLPPYPPYGPVDSYKVRYRKIDNRGVEGSWQTVDLHKSDPRLRCHGAPAETPRLCYNITGLEPGVQYRIQVAAKIEGGSFGPFCQAITANTLPDLPDAPRSISLLAKTSHSLKISWVPPEDPARLIIQYRVTAEPLTPIPGVGQKTFNVDAPTTELLMENLEPNTPYNITVRAATARGVGRGIWTTYATEPVLIPIVSTKPTITDVGPNHLQVEWNSAVDTKNVVAGYILQYRKLGEPDFREWGGIVRHDGIKRTYQERITGLEPDTNYVVRVKVVDRNSRVGDPSPQAEARTGCQPPTSPPYDIRLSAETPQEVRVRWVAPPTSTWQCSQVVYRIQYRNGTLSPLSHADVSGAVTEHVFPSSPFTKWTIQMRTQNSAGNSDWSQEIELTTPEMAPGRPRDLRGEPDGPDRIRVGWKPPTDPNGVIRGYIVSYVLKSKGDCPVPPGQPIVREVHSEKQLLKDLEPASTYEITVRAKTTVEGPASEPILVTTEETVPTGPPTNVEAASIHKTGATITWDEPSCEHRNGEIKRYEYELEGVDAWVRGDAKRASITVQRVELSELLPYSKYRFRIRALNAKGSGPYSEFLEFTTRPGAPPAPRDLKTETPSPNAIPISFLPPSPPHGIIDDYRIRYTTTDRISWHEVRKAPEELTCVGVTADSQRLCYRIADLEPRREYAIQVSAHTRDGDWGEWSASHYQPTPEPDIPVPLVAPRLSDRKSDSITVLWEGLDAKLMKHADGYVLEYVAGGSTEWIQHNDVIPSKGPLSGLIYTETVKGLQPDTAYAFRVRVVSGGKRGLPGPELRTRTLCGKPTQPPRNVKPELYDHTNVRLRWEAPPQSTWRCGKVVYVIKYNNGTHFGHVDIDPADGREFNEFPSQPGATWEFQMRTQTVDDNGARGEGSDWSNPIPLTVPGIPDSLILELEPRGPSGAQVKWSLPREFQDWNYGVDVAYRLKQRGNCPPEYQPPITLHNQQNKVILLENLEPNSVYEVTVTARTPSHLSRAGVQPPKETKEVRTGPKEPDAPPQNIRVSDVGEKTATFAWEPPPCEKQNGEITQYEYSLTGIDDWAKADLRQATTSRQRATVNELLPDTRYRLQIRAYTSAGPGPWSEPLEVKTGGSAVGVPRELHPIQVLSRQATLTWLPPIQQRGTVDSYRLKYTARDGSQRDEVVFRTDQLSCRRFSHESISAESLCYTITGLRPLTSYEVQVQARLSTGAWGGWSPATYFTTLQFDPLAAGGDLRLVLAEPDSLKVRWTPPDDIARDLSSYRVSIFDAYDRDGFPVQHYDVPASQLDYTFNNLKPNTVYNVTVQGSSAGNRLMWSISRNFQTADKSDGCVDWLPAPSNLQLLEKSQTSMYITWAPPEILVPSFNELFTHYNVTITPWDVTTRREVEGQSVSKIVNRPGNRVSFDGLHPAGVYNISIQPRTKTSCGETLWGFYSTLPVGATHILRLNWKTPTSMHVGWLPSWGANVNEYTLTVIGLSGESFFLEPRVISVPGHRTEYLIEGLTPATVYNITLVPKDKTNAAWGVYSTLPYGHVFVRNARYCDKKEFDYAGRPFWSSGAYSSIALSWTPPTKEAEASTHYQVRYRKPGSNEWVILPMRSHYELRCPGDGVKFQVCERLCFLLYNLTGPVSRQLVQVRVFTDGIWNRWKTVVDSPLSTVAQRTPEDQACCIVPPPYFVDFVGEEGTLMPVRIRAVPNDTHISRYYVVVDERDPAGEVNPETLYDKITAQAHGLPYYIAGSFDRHTLPTNAERPFNIGDGEVYGGYLNYPLIKGKKYNWFFIPYWVIGDKPVYGVLHQGRDVIRIVEDNFGRGGGSLYPDIAYLLSGGVNGGYYRDPKNQLGSTIPRGGGSYVSSQYIGGWPWWWLLLFLLLLLLLILLLCCLLWCCLGSRYRRRKRVTTVSREEYPPLLIKTEGSRRDLSDDLDRLNARIGELKDRIDTTKVIHTTTQGGKGDFEEGYIRGFRDANKLGAGTSGRERLDADYAGMKREWQEGYARGLADAGRDLSRSMQQLIVRPGGVGGYSGGYMQGFREGSAAMWGDRINMQMLRRLEELYPNQDDFRQGYIDGYKEGLHSRDDNGLNKSLDDISARLKSLEHRQVKEGDEIHTTKIYHVYNQLPETQAGYATSGQQLAHELEELSSSSRRSTLRRHYTPGDYLKYASDTEGGVGGYSSLRRHRRSLSASALGREEGPSTMERSRYAGDRTSTSRTSVNQYNDTFSRRYGYRSRSDVGAYSADGLPRRYPSQTILDGVRPGPTTPTHRREALETLQRELDTISRGSTAAGGRTSVARRFGLGESARGYSSDTGYVNDTWRGRAGAGAGYDAYQTHTSRTEKHTYSGGEQQHGASAFTKFGSPTAAALTSPPLSGLTGGRSSASSVVRNIPVQVAGGASAGGVSGSGTISDATSPVGALSHAVHSTATGSVSSSSAAAPFPQTVGSSLAQAYNLVGLSGADSSGSEMERRAATGTWTDELMDIVNEPMEESLDRMKKYSTSLSKLPPSPAPISPRQDYRRDAAGHGTGESYSATYKEEYAGSGAGH